MGVNQTYALGSTVMSAGLPIQDVSVPYLGIQGEVSCTYPVWNGIILRVKWSSGPTQQNIADLTTVLNGFDGSTGGLVNFQAALDKASAKTNTTAGTDPDARLARALVTLLLAQLNTLRQWDRSLQSAVAASTSLADLKTRIAGLTSLADLTLNQVQAAINNAIDGQ